MIKRRWSIAPVGPIATLVAEPVETPRERVRSYPVGKVTSKVARRSMRSAMREIAR
jgi:hypothetical protein